MTKPQHFTEAVAGKLRHYVYRLLDPRNGATFYIGRGQGNRVFSHATGHKQTANPDENDALKLKTIWAIRNAGFEVQHVIHRHGMNEETSIEVEAALIDAYAGLTNLQSGCDTDRGVMHAEEAIRLYEAPEAKLHHKLILINVNKTSDQEDLIDAVRYSWKIKPERANGAEYVLAVRRGLIIGTFVVDGGWLPATPEFFPLFSKVGRKGPREGRYGFSGHEAPENIKKAYLFKRVPDDLRKRGAANPIRYVNI